MRGSGVRPPRSADGIICRRRADAQLIASLPVHYTEPDVGYSCGPKNTRAVWLRQSSACAGALTPRNARPSCAAMTRDALEHLLRAAAALTNERDFVVVENQAILHTRASVDCWRVQPGPRAQA